VERGIAEAIGLDIDVMNTSGTFIINMGSEITEVSVIATGGMVLNRILKVGGVTLDQAIINHIRYNNDFLIGRLTAESLRRNLGVFNEKQASSQRVSGRNLLNGAPEQTEITATQVRAAIKEAMGASIYEIKSILERTPPEVLRNIQRTGVYLTGGLSNLSGVGTYIEGVLGVKVNVAEEPEFCAVRGLKKIIQTKELSRLTYSMLDENYRWMK
jgi:rod shape-determining protein MreB